MKLLIILQHLILLVNNFKKFNNILERWEELDQETKDKLDQDLQEILGENREDFYPEIQQIEDEFTKALQDMFDKFYNLI